MRLVKIAIANVDSTVGAVRSNVDRMLKMALQMAADDVTLAVYTEQSIGGYPAEDLVQWRSFVAAQRSELERFARETAALPTVFAVGLAVPVGGQIFNCAAAVHGGRILGLVPKEKLPTYNVFYEARTLSQGAAGLRLDADGVPLGDYLFRFDFGTVALEVCEDAWSPDGPMRRRCYSGAEVVANLSASPYRVGFAGTRREMLATRSGDNEATLVYSNAVGAQDGLIFDGGGWIFQNGRLALESERFREGWTAAVVDLDRTRRIRQENTTWRTDCEAFQLAGGKVAMIDAQGEVGTAAPTADRSRLTYPVPRGGSFFLPANPERISTLSPREEMLDELYEALALGVKDYWLKTGAFRGLGIALSGGRDSMLTLAIAWRAAALAARAASDDGAELEGDALRAKIGETIAAFYMPSRFSAEATQGAAAKFAEELGVPLVVVPIEEAFEREVDATRAMLGGGEPTEITRQNVQARIRAARMWNWSNSAGMLFLQTGDMSEKAVGYTTIGGDLEGALSVIANVPKTVVVAMLERLHARFGWPGIAATLATAPGPELALAQEAENELMPFPVLDACLHLYAGEKLSASEVARALPSLFPEIPTERLRAWAERFAVLFTRSIYKWVQAPLSLHVGSLDLDRERALQLPVVQKTEWDGDR